MSVPLVESFHSLTHIIISDVKILFTRYLFWLESSGLYRTHFASVKRHRIFDYARDMAVDNTRKRLYLVTVRDTIDSIDYDGGDRIEAFNKPTRGFRTLDILKNLLYCSNPYSDHVVEFNVNNRTIRRFIPFERGSFPSDVVVVNISVEVDGKFSVVFNQMANY